MGIFLWLLYGSVQTTGSVFGSVLLVIVEIYQVIGSGLVLGGLVLNLISSL